MEVKKNLHLILGIAAFALLTAWAYVTRKDPFWFGKVTALMSFLLFFIVLYDFYISKS